MTKPKIYTKKKRKKKEMEIKLKRTRQAHIEFMKRSSHLHHHFAHGQVCCRVAISLAAQPVPRPTLARTVVRSTSQAPTTTTTRSCHASATRTREKNTDALGRFRQQIRETERYQRSRDGARRCIHAPSSPVSQYNLTFRKSSSCHAVEQKLPGRKRSNFPLIRRNCAIPPAQKKRRLK